MTRRPARVQFFKVDRDQNLIEFLLAQDLKLPTIDHLLNYGAIYSNGVRQRKDLPVLTGATLRVHLEPKPFLRPDFTWAPEIIFEDEDFIAIDKPGGLPTHPTLDNYLENAKYLMEKYKGETLYVTHRLDVPTSGVLVLAKTPAAQSGLNKLFRKRRIVKIYRALTENAVEEGFYLHYLNLESKTPKQVSDQPQEGWVDARMHVKHLNPSGTVLQIEVETGRTHQIRAQLAQLGAPILGDLEYGSKNAFSSDERFVQGRIALECFHLGFTFRSQSIGISRPTSFVAPHNGETSGKKNLLTFTTSSPTRD